MNEKQIAWFENSWFGTACIITTMWSVITILPMIPLTVLAMLMEYEHYVAAGIWTAWHLIVLVAMIVWDRSVN